MLNMIQLVYINNILLLFHNDIFFCNFTYRCIMEMLIRLNYAACALKKEPIKSIYHFWDE